LFSDIFPNSDQFYWINSEKYFLPNEADFIDKRTKLEEAYKVALTQIEEEIQINTTEYKFLHNLLTETGVSLVKAVEFFLRDLGFDNIFNMDETNPNIREEDIQIALEESWLVIEIKGIGGTSTDSECAQISKFKYRRAEEFNSFKVFGLYIVNHQRYVDPIKRKNPPFSKHQINDAILDKRGLLTTYQLFKLYFYIKQDFITKGDAKMSLLKHGLVKFNPSRSSQIGYPPLDVHYNGKVVIVDIPSIITVTEGASIIVCNDDEWFRTEIVEIRVNKKRVKSSSGAKTSMEFTHKILQKSELWLEDIK
jgi:hypothetical protein